MQNNSKFHDKQFLSLTSGKIAGLLLTFAIPVFLSRFLSETDYGIYAQFNTFEGLFVGLLSFSMGSGLYYFHSRLKKSQFCAIIGNCLASYLLLCLIGYLFLRFTPAGIWIMGNSPVINIINLLFIATFCTLSSHLMVPFYIVAKDNRAALLYPTIEIIIRCTTTITLACIIGGLKGVITGILASRGLTLLVVVSYMTIKSRIWLKNESPGEQEKNKRKKWYNIYFDLNILGQQLRYTLPLALSATLGCVSSRIDKLICISYMDSCEYAIYVVAFLAIPGISQVQSSITEICLTEMSKCFKNNDPHGALDLLKQLEYKAISFSAPLVFAAFLYADHIVPFIYSEKYTASVPYFRAFIFTTLFEMIASGLITKASGKTKISANTSIISFVTVLPISFFAIKNYGAWGGIVSVVMNHIIQRCAYVFYEIKIVNANLKTYLPWSQLAKILAISILCLIPFAALRYFHNFNIVISGLLASAYIISVYCLEIWANIFIINRNTAISYLNNPLFRNVNISKKIIIEK